MTSLDEVTLILNAYDGAGFPITKGRALLVPSAQLVDPTGGSEGLLVFQAAVPASFQVTGFPQVKLLATSNAELLPPGWGWGITFPGVPGNPDPFFFFLDAADGETQYLSDMAHVDSVTTMAAYLLLSGGILQGALAPRPAVALADAPVVAVNAALGNDFSLSLAGDRTLGTPANPADRQRMTIFVTANGFSLSYSAAYNFGAAGTPALGDGMTILGFIYDAGTAQWLGVPPALGY